MFPNPAMNRLAVERGYVPYFYERGLHYLYRINHERVPAERPEGTLAAYDSAAVEGPCHPAERHQTVEQIIQHGYFAVPAADPTTAIISDKAQTSWLGLDDVISQIRRRYAIHEQVLYQIEMSKSAAVNAIYQHEAYRGPGSADSRQHYAKHKEIQKLYEQQREEQVNLWKDVSRLRGLLPENAQMYLAAHRKLAVLKSVPGETE
jgi:hypothetical protein